MQAVLSRVVYIKLQYKIHIRIQEIHRIIEQSQPPSLLPQTNKYHLIQVNVNAKQEKGSETIAHLGDFSIPEMHT